MGMYNHESMEMKSEIEWDGMGYKHTAYRINMISRLALEWEYQEMSFIKVA